MVLPKNPCSTPAILPRRPMTLYVHLSNLLIHRPQLFAVVFVPYTVERVTTAQEHTHPQNLQRA